MMGLARTFGWMNKNECKKQCRSLFWRVKAAVKKSVKCHQNKGKKHVTFQYDPSSYALNFDNGGDNGNGFITSIGRGSRKGETSVIINGHDEKAIGYYYRLQIFMFLAANSTLVYVLLVRY